MNSSAAEEYFGSFSPQNFMGYINSFNLSDEYKRMLWKKWNSIQKSPDYEIIERISLVVFIFVVTIGVIGNCTIIFIQISKSFLILNNTDLGVYIPISEWLIYWARFSFIALNKTYSLFIAINSIKYKKIKDPRYW